MRDDAPEAFMSVAETAERLGVTPRALRLYERKGLVAPRRTEAGWRVYGHAELERLHLVIGLKSMGLSLARIKEQLDTGAATLVSVLAAQESLLISDIAHASSALALVRRARARIAASSSLSSDELIALTKETAMSEWKSTPELEAIFHRHFSIAQREMFAQQSWSEADREASARRWGAIVARAEALMGGDPGAPAALQLARDWIAEAEAFTKGDAGVMASLIATYKEAFSTPETASSMPFSKEVWDFMSVAIAKLGAFEDAEPIV